MAKKRKGPNKSEAIRTYYEAQPEAKPKEVVAALKANGVDVNTTFVSSIRSKQLAGGGATKKVRGRPKGGTKMAVTKRAAGSRSAAALEALSLTDLLKAKKWIKELGGVDHARAALDAIDELSK